MKVVFLDIDGVINTLAEVGYRYMGADWKKLWDKDTDPERLNAYSIVFDPRAMYCLHRIIEETGAKIVISSTWRKQASLEEMKGWFLDPLISDAVIGKTPCFYDTTHPHLVCKRGYVQRGEEIYHWLQEHPEVTRYAVIDDDGDMDAVRENFFQTETYDGISFKTASKIISHLNREKWCTAYRLNIALTALYDEMVDVLRYVENDVKRELVESVGKKLSEMDSLNDSRRNNCEQSSLVHLETKYPTETPTL